MLKQEMDKNEFIKLFCKYNNIARQEMAKNNYKQNNKIMKKRDKLISNSCNKHFFEGAFLEMLNNDDIYVCLPAAVQCLKYKIGETQALKIIKEASKRKDIGVAALEAEMTLKMYNGEIPNRTL